MDTTLRYKVQRNINPCRFCAFKLLLNFVKKKHFQHIISFKLDEKSDYIHDHVCLWLLYNKTNEPLSMWHYSPDDVTTGQSVALPSYGRSRTPLYPKQQSHTSQSNCVYICLYETQWDTWLRTLLQTSSNRGHYGVYVQFMQTCTKSYLSIVLHDACRSLN